MSIRDLESTVDWITEPADPTAWCYEPQIYHAACPLIPEDAQHHYEHDAPVFGLSDGTVIGREYRPVGRGITDVYELLQFECSCGDVARVVHFADLILEDDGGRVWRIESRVNPQSENWRVVEITNDCMALIHYQTVNATLGWTKYKITQTVKDLPSL